MANIDSAICVRVARKKMKIAILAESGEHQWHDPCEGCAQKMKISIFAQRGEHQWHDPCEVCTRQIKIAILGERANIDGKICSHEFSKMCKPSNTLKNMSFGLRKND